MDNQAITGKDRARAGNRPEKAQERWRTVAPATPRAHALHVLADARHVVVRAMKDELAGAGAGMVDTSAALWNLGKHVVKAIRSLPEVAGRARAMTNDVRGGDLSEAKRLMGRSGRFAARSAREVAKHTTDLYINVPKSLVRDVRIGFGRYYHPDVSAEMLTQNARDLMSASWKSLSVGQRRERGLLASAVLRGDPTAEFRTKSAQRDGKAAWDKIGRTMARMAGSEQWQNLSWKEKQICVLGAYQLASIRRESELSGRMGKEVDDEIGALRLRRRFGHEKMYEIGDRTGPAVVGVVDIIGEAARKINTPRGRKKLNGMSDREILRDIVENVNVRKRQFGISRTAQAPARPHRSSAEDRGLEIS